jgi:hypothetical protein
MPQDQNRYRKLMDRIFTDRYKPGDKEVNFERTAITETAKSLGIDLPKNLGDIVYSFRYRTDLPVSIVKTAPEGYEWVIFPAGIGRYKFVLAREANFNPNPLMAETKIPDSTPGVIVRYTFDDEQALLAKVRYNRLIDIFSGVTCYSLQNHLRTTVPGMGQVETDEPYIGVDRRGVHYVLPVQAKGASEVLGLVQIEQDLALCAARFPTLVCRPLGAQYMAPDLIALFEFELTESRVRISAEKHYRLVALDALSPEELAAYRRRAD